MNRQQIIDFLLENSFTISIFITALLLGRLWGKSRSKTPVQECPLPQDVLLRLTMAKIQEAILKSTDHKLFLDICSKAYDNFHTLKQASEELSKK
jgi:hypothetical protein